MTKYEDKNVTVDPDPTSGLENKLWHLTQRLERVDFALSLSSKEASKALWARRLTLIDLITQITLQLEAIYAGD